MTEKMSSPIKYGMFIMPYHHPTKPLSQGYEEDIELVVRAEELGFEEFWIGEHHTMKYETIVMPEIFIGRVLGETKCRTKEPFRMMFLVERRAQLPLR